MIKVRRLLLSKVVTLFLILLFCFGDVGIYSRDGQKTLFEAALKAYVKGSYSEAVAGFEAALQAPAVAGEGFMAKVLLALGASFEKNGDEASAAEKFHALKKMIDLGQIDAVPRVGGIDTRELVVYKEVFEEGSLYNFQRPVAVEEMIEKNVVHAPRKSKEQKEEQRKRKKLPVLIIAGAVVVVGTLLVLLLTKKKTEEPDIPKIDWVRVPAGTFTMGDYFNEGEADELPAHEVYLDEYYISKYYISLYQYRKYLDSIGKQKSDLTIFGSQGELPRVQVTWEEAVGFCKWLSGETGENIHLPSEAQWEKAARGTEKIRFPWGNGPPDCGMVNYGECGPESAGYNYYVTSYSRGASPYGIFQMAGSCWEWCRDWYDPGYYAIAPANNPTGPANGTHRVVRGGSMKSPLMDIRSANRHFQEPGYVSSYLTFRIVKEK